MRGVNIVIPLNLQEQMLKLLHKAHPGMIQMKVLARSYVWSPGITQDIEQTVHQCEECQKHHREESQHPYIH